MRARECGIRIGILEPGARNAITDLAGVAVGHANHDADHTGVTVIVPRVGDDHWLYPYPAGCARLNGSGEIAGLAQVEEWGIAETPIFLTGTSYVGAVYDAATQVLSDAQPRIGRVDVLIPVVAECDPSSYCDVRKGQRPDAGLVAAALAAASAGAVAEGQIGAGVGMSCFDVAAGIGTASRIAGASTVGVLVLANFGTGDGARLTVAGHAVGDLLPPVDGKGSEGSCVCVVATDAPLLPSQLERLARRSFLGLARLGSYGANGSGEIAIAFSTANRDAFARDDPAERRTLEMLVNDALSPLFAACVEASEEAVLNALFAGRPLAGAVGRALPGFPAHAVRLRVAAGAWAPG
ncbi:MAG: P1 family peptidase [Gaiellales bacterium]